MEYLEIASRDPAFNLALEETLFRSLPAGHPGLFLLWQNDPAVIVGRHQCTAEVVNSSFVAENRLPVIRRITGGGAVYHDNGNLNFSFIRNGSIKIDFASCLVLVRDALASLGIDAQISGRNDLEVDGKKISGSGQIVENGRILHHGTLLYDTNLEHMTLALKVDEAKLKSKGVQSVRARVMNIAAIPNVRVSLTALKDALASHCASCKAVPGKDMLDAAHDLARKKYAAWEWNYGKSPSCNLERKARFAWGEVGMRLHIGQGRITACALRGDFFNLAPVADLENMVVNCPFDPASMELALEGVAWEDYFAGCDPETMRGFFVRDLFK